MIYGIALRYRLRRRPIRQQGLAILVPACKPESTGVRVDVRSIPAERAPSALDRDIPSVGVAGDAGVDRKCGIGVRAGDDAQGETGKFGILLLNEVFASIVAAGVRWVRRSLRKEPA